MKTCSKCLLPTPSVVKGMCRKCYDLSRYHEIKTSEAYKESHRLRNTKYSRSEKGRNYERNRNRQSRTGWSREMYQKALMEQGGKCAICGKESSNGRELNADHCHKTGVTRALLCHACNLGIGHFDDDASLLLKAAEYIKKHS